MDYEELMSIKVIPKDIAKSQSKSLVNNLYILLIRMKFVFFPVLNRVILKN